MGGVQQENDQFLWKKFPTFLEYGYRVSKKKDKVPITTNGVRDESGNLVKNVADIKKYIKTYFEKLGCAAMLNTGSNFDERI